MCAAVYRSVVLHSMRKGKGKAWDSARANGGASGRWVGAPGPPLSPEDCVTASLLIPTRPEARGAFLS